MQHNEFKIPVGQVTVGERHRKDLGDLQPLADSIRSLGLLQPIGVTEDNRLVFGERRLLVCRDILKWPEIPARIVKIERIVDGEYAENEIRKSFTVSERVAIAESVAAAMPVRCYRRYRRIDSGCLSRLGFHLPRGLMAEAGNLRWSKVSFRSSRSSYEISRPR